MAYTVKNYPSKAKLAADFAAGFDVYVYQQGPFGGSTLQGQITLEGPHYPKPHTWYSKAYALDGKLETLDGKTREQWRAAIEKSEARKAARKADKLDAAGIASKVQSWRPMVATIQNSKKTFNGNALRFATKEEALASARELMGRWLLVVDVDAHLTGDPVNYRFDFTNGSNVRIEA
jgi:hypothetical protein